MERPREENSCLPRASGHARGREELDRGTYHMDQQFREFLQQEAENPAFQACIHQDEEDDGPNLDQTIHAEDQSVVSEITLLSSASLFRGPLYQNPAAVDNPDDNDIANLFHKTKHSSHTREPTALNLPTLKEAQETCSSTQSRSTSRSSHPSATASHSSHLSATRQEDPPSIKIIDARQDMDAKPARISSNTAITKDKLGVANPAPKEGSDEDLAKTLAKQSHDVDVEDGQIFQGRAVVNADQKDHIVIDFGESLPGAYSATPGRDCGRLKKGRLPPHLRGDATQHNFQSGRWSVTDGTVELTDCLPEEADLPIPATFHEHQAAHGTKARTRPEAKHRKYWLAGGTILILLAVIIPTVLLLRGSGQDDEPKRGASTAHEPRPEALLVPNLKEYTLQALKDPNSYQSKAYAWAMEHHDWDAYDAWQKQQRFAMACVYHAFDGDTWEKRYGGDKGFYYYARKNRWMELSLDECEWQMPLRSQACDTRGRVRALDFRDAYIMEGFVPPEVAFLTALESIDFSDSGINTNLETLLPLNTDNSLPSLKVLNLSDSSLTGSIPSTLGLVTSLTTLDLNHNALNATIPSELGLLSHLTSLTMAQNDLSGYIPFEIGELHNLTAFSIDGNTKVEAAIPEGFCLDDHQPMVLFTTNWCRSIEHCCPV